MASLTGNTTSQSAGTTTFSPTFFIPTEGNDTRGSQAEAIGHAAIPSGYHQDGAGAEL